MNPGQGVYFRMLDFARPYAFKLLVVAVCFALAGALEVASLGQVQQVLDHGFLNADPVAARGVLIHVALTVVGIMALKGFFSYFADVLNNGVSNALVVDVRGKVFDHYTRLPLSFHSHQRLGQMVSRLGYDAAYMQTGISDVVGRVFGSGLRIVFLVAYIFYLNWHLALQVIVIFPL
ncbi:MAG: ABC transporter transmembrane domain-containing protein, partial [candidate division FCPU426 bacterium]